MPGGGTDLSGFAALHLAITCMYIYIYIYATPPPEPPLKAFFKMCGRVQHMKYFTRDVFAVVKQPWTSLDIHEFFKYLFTYTRYFEYWWCPISRRPLKIYLHISEMFEININHVFDILKYRWIHTNVKAFLEDIDYP